MTGYTHRVLIVIPASEQAAANQAATTLPGASASDDLTFTVPLNPSGLVSDPVTHYWASVQLDDVGFAMVQQFEPSFPGSTVVEWDLVTQPGYPDAVLQSLGLRRVVSGGVL